MTFPKFNEARGETASMQLVPPFQFTGVTMRVFPLRANRFLLQRFIDEQLNIIPSEAGEFSVFLPYIYLIIVNYGKMAVAAANLGWISQNEVAFSVPLIWRHEVDGKIVQDIAYISPFIYVDNPLSMTTGREVYGWPKTMAGFDPQLSSWMGNPTNRIQQASMSVDMVRDAYRGGRSSRCTLLEVDAAPFPGFTEVPFDVSNPLLPWNVWQQSMLTSAALMGDSVNMFRGILDELRTDRGRSLAAEQISRIAANPSMLAALNTVNLKQFRDAEQPDDIAYQAVTNTQMTIKSFRRGGMLGDLRTLAGDATGGYRIRVHNYDTQPIIASLGLEVASESEIEGADVSNLHPVYPFWAELDLDYPLAQVLAWRQKGSHAWFYGDAQTQTEADEKFNTARGAGGQEIAGPYQFPNATVRVLPLLADHAKLQEFVERYLNTTVAETATRFEAWGRYVYVVIVTDDATFSESNNIGDAASRQVSVFVPVKRYEQDASGARRLVSTALVPAYSYANTAAMAISLSSVNGVPTMTAEIESPANTWLADRGPSPVAVDQFLRLRGEVLPVLGLGQKADTRTIMECDNVEPVAWDDVSGWRRLGDQWAPVLKREQARKREHERDAATLREAKTLALELLGNGSAFNFVTLKQFRSGADPCRACYQALVEIPSTIEELFEIEEIEANLHVRIHEFPSQAIVSTLGLVVKDWHRGEGSQVAVLEPHRPFWFRARMRQELGTNLHVWTPSGWTTTPSPSALLSDGPTLGPTLVDEIDDGVPQYLAGQVRRWIDQGGEPLAAERARASVDGLGPQEIIEAVLSSEWEAWLAPRWGRGFQHIQTQIAQATAGAFPSEETPKTHAVLARLSAELEEPHRRAFGFQPQRFRDVAEDLETYKGLSDHFTAVQECDEHLHMLELEDAASDAPRSSGPGGISFGLPPRPGSTSESEAEAKQAARAKQQEAAQGLLRHLEALRPDKPPEAVQQIADKIAQLGSFSVSGSPPPLPPILPRNDTFKPLWDLLDQVAASLDGPSINEEDRRRLVAEIKVTLDKLRDRIIRKLAKSWQKPDACVRRRTILHDGLERHFPQRESFDDDWYVGPPVAPNDV